MPATMPARRFRSISPRERIRHLHFPDVELVTHLGRRVRFYSDLIRDKKVVVNFMYARCRGICVPVTANLARVQKAFGDRVGRDLFFYSLSLKPDEDTPEALARYAKRHGVGPGWSFLSGARADIERLRRSLGFVDPDPAVDVDTSNHIGNVLYGNEPLMLWAMCPGLSNPTWIAKAIRLQVDRPPNRL